ncbi:hypothetical protein LINPERHAP2_LOCUS2863 [Linum perenne]
MNCWFRRDWRCSFAETECVFEQIFRFDLVDSLIDSGLIPRGVVSPKLNVYLSRFSGLTWLTP